MNGGQTRAEGRGHRTMRGGGNKTNRGIQRETEHSNKPLKERKKENGKDHDDVRDCVHIGTRRELLLQDDEGDREGVHAPSQRRKVKGKRPASEAMVRQRQRFSAIAKMVMQMKAEGSKKSRKQLWKIATKAYDAENQ